VEGLRRLAASIARFTDGDGGGMSLPGAPVSRVKESAEILCF
jgi:hypothetical protein